MDTVQFLFHFVKYWNCEVIHLKTARQKQRRQRNLMLRCFNISCSLVPAVSQIVFFFSASGVQSLEQHNTKTHISSVWLCVWETESFAWICTAETGRSWEQTNKTRCKPTRVLSPLCVCVCKQADEWGKVTSSTWSAQTAVDQCVLPALWALWNCKVDNMFSSRVSKSWVTKDVWKERSVHKHTDSNEFTSHNKVK